MKHSGLQALRYFIGLRVLSIVHLDFRFFVQNQLVFRLAIRVSYSLFEIRELCLDAQNNENKSLKMKESDIIEKYMRKLEILFQRCNFVF